MSSWPAPGDEVEILRTVVGSGLHGIAIEGTDDHDEMGIFVEPVDVVLGFGTRRDHDVWRTQPEGARSGPGDIDRVRYSLRKYLHLAVKGNPTVLLPLFARGEDVLLCEPLGAELRSLAGSILSRRAGARFLGYMRAQRRKMDGTGKRPNRPELVARDGYDTKFASHALRLAIQGVELMREGVIHLPMREEHLPYLLAVKRGEVPQDEVAARIDEWSATLASLVDGGSPTPLPDEPDYDALNSFLRRAHLATWSQQ